MAESVTAVWLNTYEVCRTLFPAPALVSFGDPGAYQPDVIVAVMGGNVPVAKPTAGTNRSRNKVCEVTVVISVYEPGGDTAAAGAWSTAQAMADELEAYFRVAGNETLSGACWDSWVSNTTPSFSNVRDADSGNQTGSEANIVVTITAQVRI